MEPQMAVPSTGSLSMRWIPVADASGRTRLEAVWITETAPAQLPAAASHAA